MGRVTLFALTRPADGATFHTVEALRPHAGRLMISGVGVSDGATRARLEALADETVDAAGFDAIASIAEPEELLLTDDAWFGPFGSLDASFALADASVTDLWTLGATDEPMLVGARASVLASAPWREFWADRGAGGSTSVALAALVAALPGAPAVLHPDGTAPAIPRRVLIGDPLVLDREASAARWRLDAAAREGYPLELVWASLVGTVQPRVLNANGGMLEVLPSADLAYDPLRPLTIAALVHAFYQDMIDELLDRLAQLPAPYDLVVTTTDQTKASHIRARIAARADTGIGSSEVRVLESNRGRDQSAFYVGCRDILLDPRYDLVIKLHTKRSPQNEVTGRFFRRQQLDNLLESAGYASSVIALFQREPGLGIVFPPMIHSGFPTMGGAWFANREPLVAASRRLGIEPPIDDASPLAPYGGMFIARRTAVAAIAEEPWRWDEYPDTGEYGDGTLAHVQERLPVYSAASRGLHARTVATRSYLAMSHTMLEYKLDRISDGIHGYAADQVDLVQRRMAVDAERLAAIGRTVDGSRRDAIRFAIGKLLKRRRPPAG
jgi:lipopolysaccharide biosynthesis protein